MTKAAVARAKLLAHALTLPGAWLDHPWGEDVVKIGKKIFAFFGVDGRTIGIGVKLPRSLLFARTQPFVQRMGYGMDGSGWVVARFARADDVPVDLLRDWIEESYEALAPKKLLAAGRSSKRAPR
ncbi:MAG TPA: MmcQ/YjbR family DNA-binding protein [Candidatus Limnocylindria bacterium]|nr:MmcQ/YjbR family DNA-binding protein [Candidatus Limnocylindria bacterium]